MYVNCKINVHVGQQEGSERKYCYLTLYLIEKPFNTCENRADPDQAALVRAA